MALFVSAQRLAEHPSDPQLRMLDATVQVQIPALRTGGPEWRHHSFGSSSKLACRGAGLGGCRFFGTK
jgi:hypothetical protein